MRPLKSYKIRKFHVIPRSDLSHEAP
jgi:hypothetical protein